MSNQVEPGTIGRRRSGIRASLRRRRESRAADSAVQRQAEHGPVEWVPPHPFHGRPVSWVAVSIIMVGFLVGGLALVFGPTWWLFWVGPGLAALGGSSRWPPTSSRTGTKPSRPAHVATARHTER